jgi:hypothetical protein
MAFSTSDAFSLVRHQPGTSSSAAIFFPGCQLSGSSPDHVVAAYGHLCNQMTGGIGLMLGCCGAPAYWGGEEELFEAHLQSVLNDWVRLGRPQIITACSTCFRVFKDHLPELDVTSLWTLLESIGLPPSSASPRTLAIHDPCTNRHDEGIQNHVRQLLSANGVSVVELNEPGLTTCCGFGGLMSFVNPEVADKTVDARAEQSGLDYVTYCAMCRDNFSRRDKRALHVLDLVFEEGGDPAARKDPGFSGRQENRARLKTRLLREVWNEPMADDTESMKLTLSPDVQALAEKRLILLADIRAAIGQAETTGKKIKNARSGNLIACHRPAAVTYWVEYLPKDDGFEIFNVYSHRMTVGPEQPS